MAMTSVHSITGLWLLKILPFPVAFPVSFFSHHVLDLFPEWYPKFQNKWDLSNYKWDHWLLFLTEFFLLCGIGFYIFQSNRIIECIMIIISSNLFDLMELIYSFFNKNKKLFLCHLWSVGTMLPISNAMIDTLLVLFFFFKR